MNPLPRAMLRFMVHTLLRPAAALTVALTAALLAAPALACGPDTDCPVPAGTYRIDAPEDATGAILFAHGYRGSAGGTMNNERLRAMAHDRGAAFVALQSADDDWDIEGSPSGGTRDEVAYVLSVRDDVMERLGLEPSDVIMSGFSAGGMLTWTVACDAPDAFAGFAPFSGTFWIEGEPDACAGPATIRHHHGTSDGVVPIAGRAIGDTRQGDVDRVLGAYRAQFTMEPTDPPGIDGLECEAWTGGGARLGFCLHPGGHTFDPAWLGRFYDDVMAGAEG